MLAAIALCMGTSILLKMHLKSRKAGKSFAFPWKAAITLVPLAWLLAVTMSAGVQKIFHSDPRIGFIAQARLLSGKVESLKTAVLMEPPKPGLETSPLISSKALRDTQVQRFNALLDAAVAGTFLILVGTIAVMSLHAWWKILSGATSAALRESPAHWLPAYVVKEPGSVMTAASVLALGIALAREWSGEDRLERSLALTSRNCCETEHSASAGKAYEAAITRQFTGIRRCC
jgi:carbon starvation protein